MYLTDFEIQSPPFVYPQQEGLELMKELHNLMGQDVSERMDRVCCKPDKIGKRQTVITNEWLKIGRGFGERGRFYQTFVDEVFQKFYPEGLKAPEEIIHVTCTGYHSPSSAQKIVLERGWQEETFVTHAYHMGCMAALPALRIALGSIRRAFNRVDIVHTELCSLHMNPALHGDDQLVAQSLFADGLIKYSCVHKPNKAALKVLTVYEELIPDTADKMKWECEDWGLKMTLAKEIPILIGRSIHSFVQKLEQKSGVDLEKAHYAIHPGGPKIIEMIGKQLNLSCSQLKTSEKILYEHGNMSSATLPHIWDQMLRDPEIKPNSHIVGLAFGPGLCMAGAVLQKVEV